MAEPGDNLIRIGQPHHTTRDLKMLVYDYDDLGVKTELLPAGAIFQPWEALEHWRGERVPITLGDGHSQFDWGVTSFEGHFLKWDDFFSHCRANEPEINSSIFKPGPMTIYGDSFSSPVDESYISITLSLAADSKFTYDESRTYYSASTDIEATGWWQKVGETVTLQFQEMEHPSIFGFHAGQIVKATEVADELRFDNGLHLKLKSSP